MQSGMFQAAIRSLRQQYGQPGHSTSLAQATVLKESTMNVCPGEVMESN